MLGSRDPVLMPSRFIQPARLTLALQYIISFMSGYPNGQTARFPANRGLTVTERRLGTIRLTLGRLTPDLCLRCMRVRPAAATARYLGLDDPRREVASRRPLFPEGVARPYPTMKR
jgi:hypothetical protein